MGAWRLEVRGSSSSSSCKARNPEPGPDVAILLEGRRTATSLLLPRRFFCAWTMLMLGLRSAEARWATALRWIAAMAYGHDFYVLLHRFELLPGLWRGKNAGLRLLLVPYTPLA